MIILNEFHQYTGPAQEVLKDPMEKNPAIWILTTDRPEKVSAAIKSRAAAATFELKLLNDSQLCALLTKIDPQLLKDSVGNFFGITMSALLGKFLEPWINIWLGPVGQVR